MDFPNFKMVPQWISATQNRLYKKKLSTSIVSSVSILSEILLVSIVVVVMSEIPQLPSDNMLEYMKYM